MANQNERYQEAADLLRSRMSDIPLNQAEVAEASGVNAFTVRKIMNAVPNRYWTKNLVLVAAAVGLEKSAFTDLLPVRDAQRATPRATAADVHALLKELDEVIATGRAETAALKELVEKTVLELQSSIQELHTRIDNGAPPPRPATGGRQQARVKREPADR